MEVNEAQFQAIVDSYYDALYRFALSLSHNAQDASDLTQTTFLTWARKGHQIQDSDKVKSWLFTTLHRQFLGARRRLTRFPHHEVDSVETELPSVEPGAVDVTDANLVMTALQQIDEVYRIPLTLFYMDQRSYQEIADTLEIPIGTVMSRLSRAKTRLRQHIADAESELGIASKAPTKHESE